MADTPKEPISPEFLNHFGRMDDPRQAGKILGSVANFSDCRIDSGCWTQLSSESRKLLEWALTGCVKLLLSDHMCDFDTFQCCRG